MRPLRKIIMVNSSSKGSKYMLLHLLHNKLLLLIGTDITSFRNGHHTNLFEYPLFLQRHDILRGSSS